MKTPAAKTPKARVTNPEAYIAYLVSDEMFYRSRPKHQKSAVFLLQPFPTRAQAERAKRFANLSYEQKVERLLSVCLAKDYSTAIRAVLATMGVGP